MKRLLLLQYKQRWYERSSGSADEKERKFIWYLSLFYYRARFRRLLRGGTVRLRWHLCVINVIQVFVTQMMVARAKIAHKRERSFLLCRPAKQEESRCVVIVFGCVVAVLVSSIFIFERTTVNTQVKPFRQ